MTWLKGSLQRLTASTSPSSQILSLCQPNFTDQALAEPPPIFQDVIDGRVESCIVDPQMPPLEGAMDAQPTERSALGGYTNTNIFTSRINNAPTGKGLLGFNIAPKGRGSLRINNNLSSRGKFLGRGRQFKSE